MVNCSSWNQPLGEAAPRSLVLCLVQSLGLWHTWVVSSSKRCKSMEGAEPESTWHCFRICQGKHQRLAYLEGHSNRRGQFFFHTQANYLPLFTVYHSCKLLTENMQTTSTNCGLKTGWMTFLPDSWVTRCLEIRFGILMISLEWAICFPLLVCIADLCMSLKSRHAGSD